MTSKNSKSNRQRSHYSTRTQALSSRRYQSYLLRIWREDDDTPWRIQLEDPRTNEVIGFRSLAMLQQFLAEQLQGREKGGAAT